MSNPFMYGRPVAGEYYFDLPHLKKELKEYVDSKINILIMGSRRTGKTSFLKSFLKEQRRNKKIVIDIDAFNVLSHRDFLNQFLNAVRKEKHNTQKFFNWIKEIKSLAPIFKWETNPATGETDYSINFHKIEESDIKQAILSSLSVNEKNQLIVSIDEFQRIGELDDHGWLEATLRSIMQEIPAVVLFLPALGAAC